MKRIPDEKKNVTYRSLNDDSVMGQTTLETYQFMTERYVVLRDFIPQEIIDFALDGWKVLEQNSEYSGLDYHNVELTPTNGALGITESSYGKSYSSHSAPHSVSLNRYMKNRLSEILTIPLFETYAFSRKYFRGSMLGAHTDRASCEISCTFPLSYATDDRKPWKIWLNNEQNWIGVTQEKQYESTASIPPVQRKNCRSVRLEVGDVLLYQGPNVVHWRDTLQGDYSYHVFCHYVNAEGKLRDFCQNVLKQQNPDAIKELYKELDPVMDPSNPNRHILHPYRYDGRPDRYSDSGSRLEWYKLVEEEYRKLPQEELQMFCNNYGENIRRVDK